MPSFLYDIATTLGARMFAMIGPFAVSVMTARVLGPEERGRYFLILALAQIGAQIANLGLPSSNTYLVVNHRERVGPLMANSLLVAFTVAPLVTLVIAVAFGWPQRLGLGTATGEALGPLALGAVLISPMMLLSLYVNNMALGIGRVRLFNELTIAYSLIAVAVAAIIAGIGGSVGLFLAGTAIALVIPTIPGAWSVLVGHRDQFRLDRDLFRVGVTYAVKAYLATMFGFIMTRVGVFALQYHGNLEEVGQFSVAMQLADGLTMLPATIGILLFPKLMRIESHRRGPAMWRTFWGIAAVMLVTLVIAGVLAPWIVPLVFGLPFARAALLTQALLPSVLLLSLVSVVSQYLAAEGFPRIQVYAWLAGLLMQAGLSYWLAGKWGGMGVSLAMAISYALVFALLLFETMFRKSGRAG
ncbi:MAG: polysaccharide biosynthesis C-terminal domain-containing protein [bacterium]|nr:polysaccharide biosynthesis C-terminal domain-containing protein [bacterium]